MQGAEGKQHKKRKKPLSSFVNKDLIVKPKKACTNCIIEEDIHALCGYESVKFYPSPNVWRIENWDIGTYSSADEHSEIEPLWRLFKIKFRKLMYYRLTFEIQCIISSQWLNFRMLISRWVTTCFITVWLKPSLRVVVKYVPFFFKHLLSMRGIDVLRVRVGKSFGNNFFWYLTWLLCKHSFLPYHVCQQYILSFQTLQTICLLPDPVKM